MVFQCWHRSNDLGKQGQRRPLLPDLVGNMRTHPDLKANSLIGNIYTKIIQRLNLTL